MKEYSLTPDVNILVPQNHPVRFPGKYMGIVINNNQYWLLDSGVQRTPNQDGSGQSAVSFGDEQHDLLGIWCISPVKSDYVLFFDSTPADLGATSPENQARVPDISEYKHPETLQKPEVIAINMQPQRPH